MIVSATIDFATQDDRDRAVAASVPIQQATRDDEPGCLAYCFAADPCVDTRIQVYELWTDAESLRLHFEHPNYHNMRAKLGEFGIVGAENRKWETGRNEPVYDETHTPRADFFSV